MATDVNLNKLFIGEKEETPVNGILPKAEGRQQDKTEEESGRSEENLKPDILRPETPADNVLNHANSSPCKECETRSNGHSEEPEEDFIGDLNGDSDSLNGSPTEPDPAFMKTSISNGSLQSSYTSYLLPDKSHHSKKKTTVKKKTLNPVYDQTLRYKVCIGELRSRTLNLSVWHAAPLGRNVFLGEVEVALGLWDWTCTEPLWQDLQPRVHLNPESISIRGNIVLSIKFAPEGSEGGGLPLTGEVHIWLREAQGLLSKKGGAIDSFVKSYILPDVSRQSGQKTRVVKHSISPTYNHTMVYDGFQISDLREACAELTVWHRDGLKTDSLGGVRLSCGTGQSYGEVVSWMDSTEDEVTAWTSMIENPNRWIDMRLPIRTNLTQRP
ncbi:hypothetical protein CCH79_00008872, partial [Gambusia affinis]